MARYDGTDNLVLIDSTEKARELGRKGGIASGKAKRRKKSLMKAAEAVLSSPMPKQVKAQIEKMVGDVDDESDMLFTAATAVMVKEALSGNVAAYNSLKDIVGVIEDNMLSDTQQDDELSKSLEELGKSL